jgi:hypothetical protein
MLYPVVGAAENPLIVTVPVDEVTTTVAAELGADSSVINPKVLTLV